MILVERDRLIDVGIEEVTAAYPFGDVKREGAIDGFNLCRLLETQADYERVLNARRRREYRMVEGFHKKVVERVEADMAELGLQRDRPVSSRSVDEAYWRHRWATLQVEFIYGRLLPFMAS